MRNLGKDGGGRRAPSECRTYMVRSFPHICVPLHQRKISGNGRREDNFMVLSRERKPSEMAVALNSIANTCVSSFLGVSRRLQKA